MSTQIVVAGHITVAPADRAAYLAACTDVVRQARAADGCLDFAISADPLDSDRINVFERWSTQAAVEAFRSGGPTDDQGATMTSASVTQYDVAAQRSLT